ncbi:MAG: hypothetical protein BWY28_03197 [bacterium ADurb.Bin236]|nr:MAG: hypothetical protein BWY28_03197 [bacterium ADurb.Bin236]
MSGCEMGAGRIQPPELAVGDDGKGGFAAFEERDDGGAGVLIGGFGVPLVVLAVKGAAPRICQT